ncbi:MAG: ferredoxin, partial [Deltaproteobacteria bacterium]|nr:ferredoxin [Deltaproteobacteria bacterium]
MRCGACAEIAEGLYRLTADNQAYEVSRQPSSEEEAQAMQEALENCPVGVITAGEASTDSDASRDFGGIEVITAESKVRQTFERSPRLMKVMVGMDPIFRRLQNKVLWNTVARYASFRDAARIS